MYILAGQVQSILTSQCDEIKGINIKGQEFKIIQYADDTTLFLDGSCSSFDAALNILEIFCLLEHHNYTEKTVKKVIKKDRTEVSDQKHILNELKSYFLLR